MKHEDNEDDEGEQGIAVRNQIYSCNSGKLVTEEVEHRKYGTKANFYREGIRLTELSRYCIGPGTLLVPSNEFNSLLSIFKLWEEHHKSLPGSKSYGHSWSGWLSTDYFAAGSDKPEFTEYNPKSRAESVRKKSGNNNSKQVEEWKEKAKNPEKSLMKSWKTSFQQKLSRQKFPDLSLS